ncbi:MAG: gliding motility lipoprotein GldH [Bacteroidetes bacterium]|nr:gliding motility lipoprotein GldH [Bacteroidota bacterium]
MRAFFIVAIFVFFIIGCDSKRVFEDNAEFKDRSWKINQPVKFDFQISDTVKKYNVLLNVRNSIDYPFARLFVNYELKYQDSTSLSKKMISGFLFDQKTGKPFGTSGIGDIYDHQFPVLENYAFKKIGTYSMRIDQFMRMDTIPGVLAVGVRVENAEPAK